MCQRLQSLMSDVQGVLPRLTSLHEIALLVGLTRLPPYGVWVIRTAEAQRPVSWVRVVRTTDRALS
jgi:alkylated DNA nucleotide flippase Atl1